MSDTRAIDWIAGGDCGVSSRTIWSVMMGAKVSREWLTNYPHDPSDFGRCHRLLNLMPEWRQRLGEMAPLGPQWAALVGAWDELTALYEKEILRPDRKAPQLYDRMHDLLYPKPSPRPGSPQSGGAA